MLRLQYMEVGPSVPFGAAVMYYALLAWILTWKGIALWRAAQSHQLKWFIAILILYNTFGLLEITYLFFFAKRRLTLEDIKQFFSGMNKHRTHHTKHH